MHGGDVEETCGSCLGGDVCCSEGKLFGGCLCGFVFSEEGGKKTKPRVADLAGLSERDGNCSHLCASQRIFSSQTVYFTDLWSIISLSLGQLHISNMSSLSSREYTGIYEPRSAKITLILSYS